LKAAKKHIIILSDGLTQKADFPSLLTSLREAKITVSTVALGKDADRSLLRDIARQGNGRSYYTDDAEKIPRIFVGDTRLAAKNVIVEKPMRPVSHQESELIRGIPVQDLPLIEGQVITYPKEGAAHIFRTGEGPLLSAWQYGLGRTVAFTSDLSAGWGRAWVQWGHFGAFTSQMVKWAQRKETDINYQVEWDRKDGRTVFQVDVTDERGNWVNFLDLKAKILLPTGVSRIVTLDQKTPGRYQGAFFSEEMGEYFINLYASSTGGSIAPKIFGYAVPYADEFQETGTNRKLLSSLATLTRGRLLDINNSPEGLFSTNGRTRELSPPLWPWLILAAMLLLVVEVGIRKFISLGFFKKSSIPAFK
jgi:hypothetical protein